MLRFKKERRASAHLCTLLLRSLANIKLIASPVGVDELRNTDAEMKQIQCQMRAVSFLMASLNVTRVSRWHPRAPPLACEVLWRDLTRCVSLDGTLVKV